MTQKGATLGHCARCGYVANVHDLNSSSSCPQCGALIDTFIGDVPSKTAKKFVVEVDGEKVEVEAENEDEAMAQAAHAEFRKRDYDKGDRGYLGDGKTGANWTREDNIELDPGFTPHEASEILKEMEQLDEELPFFSTKKYVIARNAQRKMEDQRAAKKMARRAALEAHPSASLAPYFDPPDVTDSLMFPGD